MIKLDGNESFHGPSQSILCFLWMCTHHLKELYLSFSFMYGMLPLLRKMHYESINMVLHQ